MASIQGSINQLIGTAAFLTNTNPTLKARAESRAREAKLKHADINLQQALNATRSQTTKEAASISKDIMARQKVIAERRFFNRPNKETYNRLLSLMSEETPERSSTTPQRIAAHTAESHMMAAVEAKRAQRREFMAYLKMQPVGWGGTIGDLDLGLQKQIAAQYSDEERKALMDKMDKEAKGGKHK